MPPAGAPAPFTSLYQDDHSVQPVLTPIGNEMGFYRDWLKLRLSPVYYGLDVPHGNGEPVVVVPGFMGTDLSLMELFWWLGRIGYEPYYSGLGLNVDCPDASTELVLGVVRRAAEEAGRPVHLIGHSLGALIARSVAFEHPESVDLLISLAAPFNEVAYVHPALIEAMAAVRRQAGSHLTWNVAPACYSGHCTCRFTAHIMRPSEPTFRRRALYAERDGLVRPESCTENEPELNIGIATTHYGIIYNSEAYRTVAGLLAEANE
jgi:pimeloyl-ACP methyl ester carboxylesterase